MPRNLLVNPTYEPVLSRLGLRTAADFLRLEGGIVSGHSDRHVMRLTIGGMPCFLKREHRVPFRDRLTSYLAGFGRVSISGREAQTLRMLPTLGIPAPEWIAHGESADGRAFLLLKDIGPAPDLRDSLTHCPPRDRRRVARRLGCQVAAIHRTGLTYPDLYAKHILVTGDSFTFLDWQRSRRRRHLSWTERCRDLAALNASLADEIASADDRLSFLVAYFKAIPGEGIPMRVACDRIRRCTRVLMKRSSIIEQRLPAIRESQALHWLDGERLCLTDIGREALDVQDLRRRAYETSRGERTIQLGGVTAVLSTRRSLRPLQRYWQSPECRRAAQLLREERLGLPRQLLAFGQWRRGWARVDSFLLCARTGESA